MGAMPGRWTEERAELCSKKMTLATVLGPDYEKGIWKQEYQVGGYLEIQGRDGDDFGRVGVVQLTC